VWRVDRAWIPAAFGLARARVEAGDIDGAVAVLDEVPTTSAHHGDAGVAAVRLLAGTGRGRTPTHDQLLDAGRRAAAVELDVVARAALEAEVLEAGRAWVHARPEGPDADTGETLLGGPLHARGIGFGLEARHRTRARYARTLSERIALVDRANDARPWTRV
jgi:serine/threonine-protein kinase PknG